MQNQEVFQSKSLPKHEYFEINLQYSNLLAPIKLRLWTEKAKESIESGLVQLINL